MYREKGSWYWHIESTIFVQKLQANNEERDRGRDRDRETGRETDRNLFSAN